MPVIGTLSSDGKTIAFSDNQIWRALEFRVIELFNEKSIEYLTKQSIEWHIHDAMDTVFGRIEEIAKSGDTHGALCEIPSERFMNAIYITTQLVLEEVLSDIHLKPEWQTNKLWSDIVKAKKENTK